jgi:hypothetical protein
LEAALVRDLANDFLGDHLVRSRSVTAEYLMGRGREAAQPIDVCAPPIEVYEVLDFFDMVGMYYVRGVISADLAFSAFYYWLGHYWQWIGEYTEAFHEAHGGLTYYRDLFRFYEELTAFAQEHRNMPSTDTYFTDERLTAFLLDEIATCAPTVARDGSPGQRVVG